MSGGIRARLEIDDGFAGFGVTEFFAGQSLHCFGVRPQGANRGVETAGMLFLFSDFRFEAQNLLAHPFVLLDERKVPDADAQHDGDDQQDNNRAR